MEIKGTFTHFMSIPLISNHARDVLGRYQQNIMYKAFKEQDKPALRRNNPNFFHITICMLALTAQTRPKAQQIMNRYSEKVKDLLKDVSFKFSGLKCFRGKKGGQIGIIYLDIIKNQAYDNFYKVADLLIRQMIKEQVIFPNQLKAMHIQYDHNKGLYRPIDPHLTVFRTDSNHVKNVDFDSAMKKAQQFQLKEEFPAFTVDISIRNTKDQSGFCIPLARITI